MNWVEKSKASVLVGGQFGSEGKGNIASWLAMQDGPTIDIATTNAGAQAGHTTKFRDGRSFVCFHLPSVGVIDTESTIYANGGSIIDVDQLKRELDQDFLINVAAKKRLCIHPRAAVITEEAKTAAKDMEKSPGIKYGAIQKGVGQTLAGKVLRKARLAQDEPRLKPFVRELDINEALANCYATVSVEIPQGTGLGLIHGYSYPYVTSRDCWVGSGLNDAGIHPSFLGRVCMVVRTYPIRVGHFYNELGEKLGDSGPFWPDGPELTWDHFPGIEPERTTVSKRVRRIARWSDAQYEHALRLNRPDIVALTFCDYLKDANHFYRRLNRMRQTEAKVFGTITHVNYAFSFGPNVEDVTTSAGDVEYFLQKRGSLR